MIFFPETTEVIEAIRVQSHPADAAGWFCTQKNAKENPVRPEILTRLHGKFFCLVRQDQMRFDCEESDCRYLPVLVPASSPARL